MMPHLKQSQAIFKYIIFLANVWQQRSWFPNGVPRHTRVPHGGARGAASYYISKVIWAILTTRVPSGVARNFPWGVQLDNFG